MGEYKRKHINKKTRLRVWNKYKHKCAYCGCDLEYKDMQVDHIIPHYWYSEIYGCIIDRGTKITAYGIDDFENLNPACRVCNKWKSVWTIEEFRHEIQDQIERLKRNAAGFRIALKYEILELTGNKVEFYFEKKEEE